MTKHAGMLRHDMINIYLFDEIDSLGDDFVQNNMPALPRFRREECERYQQDFDKKACVAAFLLLQYGLRKQFGITEPVTFDYNEHGKPYLREFPNVHFNLSHCKKAIVCVLSDAEVGVDVQDIRSLNMNTALRTCSESEIEQLEKSEYSERLFCKFWTQKESYSKANNVQLTSVFKRDLSSEEFYTFEHSDYFLTVYQTETADISLIKLTKGDMGNY